MTTRNRNQSSGRICAHQDCNQLTPRNDYPLCRQHYDAAESGGINKCSGCANYKPSQFPLCAACYAGQGRGANPGASLRTAQSRPQVSAATPAQDKYAPESSPKWAAGDANATEFYVYILRLVGGEFYVGQTRELPERLSEHRDGKVQSTRERKPRLIWFTELSSREAATALESELKRTADFEPRKIRRMMVSFRELVRELDFSEV